MMKNSRALTRPWLPEEEARLLSLFSEGATADEVGAQLGRTRQAVYARLLRFREVTLRCGPLPGDNLGCDSLLIDLQANEQT
jgi:hypothetical protein